ncbi:Leucine rich repeat-containing protein, partial [Durusdinium trenchii]
DKLALENVPDISTERTWTGRSVETLLQCFSGLERVRARYKVGFRILCRMADVLDGHSDFLESSEDEEGQLQRLLEEEAQIWDEEQMRKNLGYLERSSGRSTCATRDLHLCEWCAEA